MTQELLLESLPRLGQDQVRGTSSGNLLLADGVSLWLMENGTDHFLASVATTPYLLESTKRHTTLASFDRFDSGEDVVIPLGFFQLANGTDYLLLADGTSKLYMSHPVRAWILN